MLAANAKSGKPLSTAWRRGLRALLDAYFGERPERFIYEAGNTRRSRSPRRSRSTWRGLRRHHVVHPPPFYTKFVLEIPDNWMWGAGYNLPLDELMTSIDHALASSYTVAWGTDVRREGTSRTEAIGIVPKPIPTGR